MEETNACTETKNTPAENPANQISIYDCQVCSYLITTVTSNKFWLEIPAETSCITGTRPKNPIFKMTLALKSRKRHRSEHGFLAF